MRWLEPALLSSLFILFLVVDVLLDGCLFQANGTHSVPSGPEVLTIEVPGLAAELSGDGNGAFAFQKADDGTDLDFGWYFDEHMDMVGHEVTLDYLAVFLARERVKDFAEARAYLAVEHFLSHLWHKDDMVFTVPLGVR